MNSSDTPHDHNRPPKSEGAKLTTASEEGNTETTDSRLPVDQSTETLAPPQSTHPKAEKLPRCLRRRAAREEAKRQKRSGGGTARPADIDPEFLVEVFKAERDKMLELLNTEYRKFQMSEASRRQEAVINPGLVIVRGEGAPNDDDVITSVFNRVWGHGRVAVCILDSVVFDALPIVYKDPFEELRESPLTGATTSDQVFAITFAFYNTAHSTGPLDRPALPDEHRIDLLRQIHELATEDAWRYPLDTPPLSSLAQRVLLHVTHLALTANKSVTIAEVRRLIAHGRFLELIDPRDGPV